MNIRVTAQSQTAGAIANIQRQNSALAKYQAQISSGVRVALPSDDPTAYPTLFRETAVGHRYDAHLQTMSDSTATLDAGVAALGDVNDALTRAKQIAIEGADGTTDAFGRNTLATEVDQLIGTVLSAANQQQDGRALFGGTATGADPFRVATTDAQGRPATIAYAGAAENARALIGPNQTLDTRYAGSAVFQKTGADVFQSLIGLRDALRAPNADSATLNQQLANVDAARDAVGDATAELSSGLVAVQSISSRVSDLKLSSDIRVGELGGTDYAEAIVRMQAQQNSLQASLAVSARLLQPTLLDFIR